MTRELITYHEVFPHLALACSNLILILIEKYNFHAKMQSGLEETTMILLVFM